ncbi:MAG: hypothetical protein LBM66_04350 [Bifidobacteriaceae bacterium]|nr:hypothetical protein [Bifidobacteriaceae bacterium]
MSAATTSTVPATGIVTLGAAVPVWPADVLAAAEPPAGCASTVATDGATETATAPATASTAAVAAATSAGMGRAAWMGRVMALTITVFLSR